MVSRAIKTLPFAGIFHGWEKQFGEELELLLGF